MAKPSEQPAPVRWTRVIALIVFVALCLSAAGVCFGASYLGGYQWAAGHGLTGWRARVWPVSVDVLLLAGELALLVAVIDSFRERWIAWTAGIMTALGLGLSVAGNVGAARGSALNHATWAVFPAVAAVTFAAGLAVLRAILSERKPKATAVQPPATGGPQRVKAPVTGRRKRTPRSVKDKAAVVVAAELARTPDPELPSALSLSARLYGDRRLAGKLLDDRRASGMVAA